MRLGNMSLNPSNPDQHGTIPLGLLNRVKQLQGIYSKSINCKYPGLDGIYDFNLSGRLKDYLLNHNSSSNVSD